MAGYKNLRKIGSGGFGEVWKCKRVQDGHFFAKKILRTKNPEDIRRFVREVRILSSLDHPNIVKIRGKRLETPPYFYIMPFYKYSLYDEIQNIANDEERIIKIFSSVLDGIEYAHLQGVIHRDLKPENILMNNDDDIVISDFGLGRQFDAISTRQTLAGNGLGTPIYMAPEQIRDAQNANERSDIYSLGRILYELYVGVLSFGIQDNSKLPPPVQVVVSRCVQENPNDRYESVYEFKQDWLSIFKVEGYEKDLEEFAILRSSQSLSPSQARRLLQLFSKYARDADSLHEALMKTDPEAIASLYYQNEDFVRRLISDFTEFASAQGWGFSYTDKIGNWCKKVFYRIEDSHIRTDLVKCTLQVGVGHNRFYVLEIFSNLIEKVRETGEVLLLKNKLEKIGQWTRKKAIPYMKLGSISPLLQSMFQEVD